MQDTMQNMNAYFDKKLWQNSNFGLRRYTEKDAALNKKGSFLGDLFCFWKKKMT